MPSDSDRRGRTGRVCALDRDPLAAIRRWLTSVWVLAGLSASLAGGALAQSSAQPAVPPAATDAVQAPAPAAPLPEFQRLETPADAATASFRRAVAGTSLMVGVSRTYPTITIIDLNDSSTDPTIEQYRGDNLPGYTLSWHVGFEEQPIAANRLGGTLYSGLTVRLAAEADTFSARQTLLRRSVGHNAQGVITGNVVWGGLEMLTLLAWENPVVPMAWSASVYIGLAAVQFQGDLEFTSSGAPYKGTAASNGISPILVIPFELRWHFGPVVLRHIWIDSQFSLGDMGAKLEYRGSSLANAAYQYTIGITTLGYAFTF